MTPNEYQKAAMRTECDQARATSRMSQDYVRLTHAFAGISKQAGELWKALIRYVYYSQPFDRTNVVEELGDILWHVAQACETVGVTMEEVMAANLRKLKERYPQRFMEERAANRDLDAELRAIEGADIADRFLNQDIGGES